MSVPSRPSGSLRSHIFESVYLVMQVSNCYYQLGSMVLPPVRVMHIFSSLVPCTRWMNACPPRTFTNRPQARLARVWPAKTLLQRREMTEGVHSIVSMCMRKLQSSGCVVAFGNSRYSVFDSSCACISRAVGSPWPAPGPGCSTAAATYHSEFSSWDSLGRDHYKCVMMRVITIARRIHVSKERFD